MNQEEQLRLPNFLCIGAQKAGSSTLYKLLKQHPDVYMSETKEVHFFDRDNKFEKGLAYYSTYFQENYNGEKAIGEVTPDYIQLGFIPERIKEALGEVKILAILRHPVKRAYSQYNFYKALGRDDNQKSFYETLDKEESNLNIQEKNKWNPPFYKSRSLYYNQIKRYVDEFGIENVKVVVFEEMFQNGEPDLTVCCDFLGIAPFQFNNDHSNPTIMNLRSKKIKTFQLLNKRIQGVVPTSILEPIRNVLKQKLLEKPEVLSKKDVDELYRLYFKDDTEKLEKLLGIDLSVWK